MATSDRDKHTGRESNRELARSSERHPAGRREYDPFSFSANEFFSNPFSIMRRMHDDMDRLFSDALGQHSGRASMGGLGSWSPAVEVSERGNELCVCAELPGLQPENVKIEVTDDALIIEGERKQERTDEQGGRWHSERHYGRFHRTVPLPEGAQTEQARAEFRHGELRVTVPVQRPESKRRQIPIEHA
jgi:HSP20 family protein